METCVGGILNLGETPRQRVEMAFELAEVDPTSVPINLLNPRSGTKFGDRELMDPWDVVKWIAIFRLILPDALFRLCGGRVENLHELQPLAVKAGLNGVMMGNFLTTLGAEPADDREMFTDLGLNVARQPDNGSNPRPDNRSGWLEGDSPRTPVDDLIDSQAEADFWDPSTQLRVVKKKQQAPRLPNPLRPHPRRPRLRDATTRPTGRPTVEERLDAIREDGLFRRMRTVGSAAGSADRARRPATCCCSAPTTTSASPPTRRCRTAAVEATERWGDRRRRVPPGLREHGASRPARAAARRLPRDRDGAAVRLRLPGQHRRHRRARPPRRDRLLRRAQPRQHHRRLPARRGQDVRLSPPRPRAPRLGPGAGTRARRSDRHRRPLLDGRRRRPARLAARAGQSSRGEADGRRRPCGRSPRPGWARLRRRGRARRRGRCPDRHARQVAGQLRRLRVRLPRGSRPARQHRPAADLLDRACRPPSSLRRRPRSAIVESEPARIDRLRENASTLRAGAGGERPRGRRRRRSDHAGRDRRP